MSNYEIFGNVRGTSRPNYPEGVYNKVQENSGGDLLVAQALPPKTELTRMGNTWCAHIAAASAFTLVAALPTTRAELMLYNGEPAGGKSYVIDSVWLTTIVTTTALTPVTLLVQLVPAATMTAPTNDLTGILFSSRSGKAAYGGYAKRALATATCVANMWQSVGSGTGAATASIATGCFADVFGGFVVPPGAGFGINAICGTTVGASGIMGLTWSEVQLQLG